MKTLYDHKIFELQEFGGVSRYFCEIISAISNEINTEIAVKYSNNFYLKNKKLVEIEPIRNYREGFIEGIEFKGKGRLFNLIKMFNRGKYPDPYQKNLDYTIELLKKQKFDLFHPTLYDPYFLDYIGKKPFVLTIHDMIHELYPEFIHKDDLNTIWKKELAERASHIISVSENTKKDIMEILGIPDNKISVIYHGVPDINIRIEKKDYNKFLLYVGERHGYKNFIFFVYSISEILKEFNLNLICTGPDFNEYEQRKFIEMGIHERVIHCRADDEELYGLYSNAIAFVFPSLYEGFGIPIIEAYSCDCPVIISRISCFQEIAGNAALFFDPKSKTEIYSQVKNMIGNNSLRNQLISLGKERSKIFSWTNASMQIIDLYKKIA